MAVLKGSKDDDDDDDVDDDDESVFWRNVFFDTCCFEVRMYACLVKKLQR